MKKLSIFQISLLFLCWLACTAGPSLVNPHSEGSTLLLVIKERFSLPILFACIILIGYTLFSKSSQAIGFKTPRFTKKWILIYPVTVITVLLIFVARLGGFNNFHDYEWILINTILVGFSEELMFRGFILSALIQRVSFVKTVIAVSLLFGLVHLTNYFVTGELLSSISQAGFAAFSGLLFLALRVNSKSIWPGMIVHALFDFLVMMKLSMGNANTSDSFGVIAGIILAISPVVFGIIGFIQLSKKETLEEFLMEQV